MTHLAPSFARGLAAVLLVVGCSTIFACSKITTIEPEAPIEIQAQPPAPPLPELPAVKQPPPPPPRVTVEDDVLRLDEAIGFDEQGKLSADQQDILAEVSSWLAANPDVLELSVEVQSAGGGSRRARQKRNEAMATQIIDVLVQQGVDRKRVVAVDGGKSEAEQIQVILRISKRAEVVVEEKPE